MLLIGRDTGTCLRIFGIDSFYLSLLACIALSTLFFGDTHLQITYLLSSITLCVPIYVVSFIEGAGALSFPAKLCDTVDSAMVQNEFHLSSF